jgi:uncharacterized protein YjiS (DUF1127 family)
LWRRRNITALAERSDPMLLSLFGNGLGRDAASARRLRRLHFRAGRALDRLAMRCDRALRAWGARRLAREMQSWPDERLRDIGLTRAEIAEAIEGVRRPFRWAPDHEAAKLDPSRFGH